MPPTVYLIHACWTCACLVTSGDRRSPAPSWLAGVVVGLLLLRLLPGLASPNLPHAAMLQSIVVFFALVRVLPVPLLAALSGVFASLFLAMELSFAEGLMPCAASLAAMITSRATPLFCHPVLRDEALMAILVMGLALALGPEITAGWNTAGSLQVEGGQTLPSPGSPSWIIPCLMLATATGMGWVLFVRWSKTLRNTR